MRDSTASPPRAQRHRVPCRPRQVIADAVKAGRRASWIRSRVHGHLKTILRALPRGRVGAPVRGRAAATTFVGGIGEAYTRRLADPEGSAVELFTWLASHGLLDGRVPQRVAAEHALRLLVSLTPLVVRLSAGRYRVLLRAYRDDEIHDDRLAELVRLQTVTAVRLASQCKGPVQEPRCEAREPVYASASVPSAAAAEPIFDALRHPEFPAKSPVCASESAKSPDSSRARAASQTKSSALPVCPPSSRSFSRSAWRHAAERGRHRHVRSLAGLALRHLPHVRGSGTPAEVAERLAWREGRRVSGRERYRLGRALLALERRGLLVYEGDTWRLPDLAGEVQARPRTRRTAPASKPLTAAAPAPTVDRRRDIDMSLWRTIVDAVSERWGGAAAFDLEARGGLVGEVLDLARQAEPHVLEAALKTALSGPAPRAMVGAVLAKGLRLAIAEERRKLPSIDRAVGHDTAYMRALASLTGG